jgi:hypothetical protein
VSDQVRAILAWNPAREREVHEVAWRAAGIGTPHRSSAVRELGELWKQADPVAAAAMEAKIRELEESVAKLKSQDGKSSRP